MVMKHDIEPRILGFLCNWCAYAGADLAGVSRFQYLPNIRVIRVMCSSRVDPAFILRAFSNGVDGVLVGGCHLGECHYMRGNYAALSMTYLCKKLLEEIGLNPERLRIEWVSAAEGILFAEIVSNFTKQLKKLGPLGMGEGKDVNRVKLKLQAATSLVPYIKLVEREKLRLRLERETEYSEFFSRDEVNRLLRELIGGKLRMSEILLLLRERYLSTGEISEILGLSPSELSGYLDSLARGGLIRFDESQRRFAPA
jgi:coenzyme F420-reducing hydrogenase delta subunit